MSNSTLVITQVLELPLSYHEFKSKPSMPPTDAPSRAGFDTKIDQRSRRDGLFFASVLSCWERNNIMHIKQVQLTANAKKNDQHAKDNSADLCLFHRASCRKQVLTCIPQESSSHEKTKGMLKHMKHTCLFTPNQVK